MALDKLEPPLQVLRIPSFPHPSLAPWVNRELDMVAGKYLYSAQGQDKEVGVASATGTGGQHRVGLRAGAQGHQQMAHQRGSVGLYLNVHF